ncbi:hypothetical protein BC792_101274 [Sphingobacterium allocomposti]|jgi:hypothetical protein|uniref:Uncharacterized protein n=1 Tax=Sphingobacterium allocomposti TaxID=415956 RepID=A0A5S5DUD0_9SPHI|nr:hypothetical protein BC792_101274 [Sphingobacterium composti Yoo et al. 2007 non Ten et al. 2007]
METMFVEPEISLFIAACLVVAAFIIFKLYSKFVKDF